MNQNDHRFAATMLVMNVIAFWPAFYMSGALMQLNYQPLRCARAMSASKILTDVKERETAHI